MLHRLLAASFLLAAVTASGAAPNPPSFVSVPEYGNYATLPSGELLMFVQRGSDMCVRTSRDDGVTWNEPQTLFTLPNTSGTWGLHNALVDRDGEVHMFFTNDDGTAVAPKSIYQVRYDVWHVRSRRGRTEWTAPKLIKRGYYGSMLSSLQMRSGRILLPVCYLTPRTWSDRGTGFDAFTFMGRFSSSVLYSDDGGDTWQASPVEWKVPSPIIGADGVIEPIGLQLKDGRVWMLLRTQLGRLFESYSTDGANWTPMAPTTILSSDSPPGLVRLPDGRMVLLWNNCQRFAYANGGRHVLHGAISRDEGKTWRGCREVARNPLVNEPPPPRGDHGVSYTLPNAARNSRVVTPISVGGTGGTYLLWVDPDWLLETRQRADFGARWSEWATFGTKGVDAVPHPDRPDARVLSLRKPAADWPSGATWNFPAGNRGRLELRFLLKPGFQGARIGLTDHFSVPFDPQDACYDLFEVTVGRDGALLGTSVPPGQWQTMGLAWDAGRRSCTVTLNGKRLRTLTMSRSAPMGVSYVRLRSTAETTDDAGMLVESVEAEVSPR